MRILFFYFFIVLIFPSGAQVFTLSGKITDDKKNALPFASVILKGTTIGDRSIIGIRTIVTAGNYPNDSTIVSGKPVILKR